jgi:hypothetical protein
MKPRKKRVLCTEQQYERLSRIEQRAVTSFEAEPNLRAYSEKTAKGSAYGWIVLLNPNGNVDFLETTLVTLLVHLPSSAETNLKLAVDFGVPSYGD